MTNWQLIATLAALIGGTFGSTWLNTTMLKHYIDAKLETVNAKLDSLTTQVDLKFGIVNERLDKVDKRLDDIERQLEYGKIRV